MRYINKKKENCSMKESSTISAFDLISFIEQIHKYGTVGRDRMHWEFGGFLIIPTVNFHKIEVVNSIFDINPEIYKAKLLEVRIITQSDKNDLVTLSNKKKKFGHIMLDKNLLMVFGDFATFQLWAN